MASNAENVSIWWRHHDWVHHGLKVMFICLQITLSHYHHYADFSGNTGHENSCQMCSVAVECVSKIESTQLSFMQYVGLCVFSSSIYIWWLWKYLYLTHWGLVTHICVRKLTIICSDNGLSPDRRQAIIWTNAGLLLIGPLGTNFSEILIEILTFSFKKMRLKVPSVKRWPFCLGLNVLILSSPSDRKYEILDLA